MVDESMNNVLGRLAGNLLPYRVSRQPRDHDFSLCDYLKRWMTRSQYIPPQRRADLDRIKADHEMASFHQIGGHRRAYISQSDERTFFNRLSFAHTSEVVLALVRTSRANWRCNIAVSKRPNKAMHSPIAKISLRASPSHLTLQGASSGFARE